ICRRLGPIFFQRQNSNGKLKVTVHWGEREITEQTEKTEQTETNQKTFCLFRFFRLFRNLLCPPP
ncbi:MAG: hypothetical protein ACREAM_05960, partial [Blastocatellia bacterium]